MTDVKGASHLNTRSAFCQALLVSLLALMPLTSAAAEEDATGLVEMVITLLEDQDKDMRALGLEQVRTQMPGAKVTRQLAAQLPQLPTVVQVELIRALTDRGDAGARPAIVSLVAATDQESVQVAGLRALGFLGMAKDVDLLVRKLDQGNSAVQTAARQSLIRMPGDDVSQSIMTKIDQAEESLQIALMKILVERRAFVVADRLLPFALADDAKLRIAAMAALSELAGPEQMEGLVQGVLTARVGRERDTAEKCVMRVCQRVEESGDAVDSLLAATTRLTPEQRVLMLPTLGRVGGSAALNQVGQAIASQEPAVHEAGVRSLCNWPNASVAPELFQIVKTDRHAGCRMAALRALIRVAPLRDGRSDAEKLDLLKAAWPLCQRDQERKLILRRASAVRTVDALRFLTPYLEDPAFAESASQSIVELAHHRELRDAHKIEFTTALKQIKQVSKNATVLERADRYLKGQTWTGR
jgi:hypothetical protein